jgi:type I restriction enzyme S subunit
MTPQELKNSILQRAIQGKLVEQRPEEGNAEELYQQIQSESINMDKTPVNIVDDDKPFDIPDSWKWVRLKNIAVLHNGRAYKQTELLNAGKYPVLRVGNLFTSNNWYYSNLELEQEKYCDDGDLLYSWSASFGPFIWNSGKVIYHYHIWKVQYSRFVYRDFLYYLLLADTDSIKRSGHGLAMIHVTKAGTEERIIPLPPLAEQKRIVAKIEELLPYIDRYEQAWSKLEDFNKRFPTDMQKSILQMAIQGKLVEQRLEEGTGEELCKQVQTEKQRQIKAGTTKKEKPLTEITEDEIPFEIPETWKWVRLREICNAEISYGIIKLGDEDKNGVRVLRCSDVKENHIVPNFIRTVATELSQQFGRTILHGGEIVINVRGTLGGCAVVPQSMKGYNVAREVAVIRQCPNTSAQYIVFLLMSQYFQTFMFHGLRGIAYKGLNMGILSSLPVPIPPLAEQKRIVAKLEEILPLCEKLKK